uniref:C2H2-type domain-containing protein n=1 Tax=Rhodosorus marinus TaxID=101924 RepID=A0A7S2ZQ30_9RHOD
MMRQLDSFPGEHVSELAPLLKWDSLPLSWALFLHHSETVRPLQDGSVVLMDSKFTVPEATRKALEASEIVRMVSVLTQPLLIMMETREEDYFMFSGWAFLGGLPELEGRSNDMYSGVKRVRLVSTVENGKAMLVVTAEVQPGIVALLTVFEIDERHNLSAWSVVDKEKQTIINIQGQIDRRSCDMCLLTGDICDPRICNNRQSFEQVRAAKESHVDSLGNPACTVHFIEDWLSGKWTMGAGPLTPITVDATGRSGPVLEYALASALQIEIAVLHPPRSSYRLVTQAREEAYSLLSLEELNSASGNKESLEIEESFAFLSPSESMNLARMPDLEKRLFRCQICGNTFKRGYDLKRHVVAVHQKSRELQCTYCARTFKHRGHLNEHIRVVHTQENVFICPICGKTFGADSKLMRHVTTVHENRRNFTCKVCGNSYKEKAYLKKHLLSQHNLRVDKIGRRTVSNKSE